MVRRSAPVTGPKPVAKREKKADPLDGLNVFDPADMMKIVRIVGTKFVDVDKPFDPGNVYVQVKPFTTIPAWMRSFMFRILKANEIAVYLYISTFAQKPGISWVSLREMQRDFGFSNRHELIAAIEQLIELGFLLKEKGRVARSRTEHDRSVYQRPSVIFTLSKLLTIGAIDGSFNPTPKAARRARRGSAPIRNNRPIEKPMLDALEALLGRPTLKAYLYKPAAEKASFLITALEAKLAQDRSVASVAAADTVPAKDAPFK